MKVIKTDTILFHITKKKEKKKIHTQRSPSEAWSKNVHVFTKPLANMVVESLQRVNNMFIQNGKGVEQTGQQCKVTYIIPTKKPLRWLIIIPTWRFSLLVRSGCYRSSVNILVFTPLLSYVRKWKLHILLKSCQYISLIKTFWFQTLCCINNT